MKRKHVLRSSIPDFVFAKWVGCSLFVTINIISLIHEKMVGVTDDVFKCPMPGYWGTSIPDFAPQKVVCFCIFLTFGIVSPISCNLRSCYYVTGSRTITWSLICLIFLEFSKGGFTLCDGRMFVYTILQCKHRCNFQCDFLSGAKKTESEKSGLTIFECYNIS